MLQVHKSYLVTQDEQGILIVDQHALHERVMFEELRQRVLSVLRSMPEEYRLPLTLRYLVGADYESIQMQMGLTNGSLRGLLHRGMKQMRAELQKVLGVEPIAR